MYRVNINLKSFNPRAINASINSIKKITHSLNFLSDHLAESTAILNYGKPAMGLKRSEGPTTNFSKSEIKQN